MSERIKDGGPAFPALDVPENFKGMTLRHYFAAKAMQGVLTNLPKPLYGPDWQALVAQEAYSIADAMISESTSKANRCRADACVDACAGIPTEELEPGEYERHIIESGFEIGRLTAQRDELLAELRHAHQIIRNARRIMTTAQAWKLSDMNKLAGITGEDVLGEGVTRANEREALIKRAES